MNLPVCLDVCYSRIGSRHADKILCVPHPQPRHRNTPLRSNFGWARFFVLPSTPRTQIVHQPEDRYRGEKVASWKPTRFTPPVRDRDRNSLFFSSFRQILNSSVLGPGGIEQLSKQPRTRDAQELPRTKLHERERRMQYRSALFFVKLFVCITRERHTPIPACSTSISSLASQLTNALP
ncbi:hypothetical protein VTK26DRAFT_5329 [Humicola hyalothermophila]